MRQKIFPAIFAAIYFWLFSTTIYSSPLPHENLWFKGSFTQALTEAEKNNQKILVYWGAAWCPPCNELKAMVFAHPEFPEVVRPYLIIYMDGDDEGAQSWADKQKVSGYPTLLVLNSNGRELLRLDGSLSFKDFAAALSSLTKVNDHALNLLKKSATQKLSTQEWSLLGAVDWTQDLGEDAPQNSLSQKLLAAFKKCPGDLTVARARLASAVFLTTPKKVNYAKAELRALEGALWSSKDALATSSTFILTSTEEILSHFYSKTLPATKKWLSQAAAAAETSPFPEQAKVQYLNLAWQLEPSSHPQTAKEVLQLTSRVEQSMHDTFKRHALISDLAELLTKVGHFDTAQAVLEKEIKVSDTPWYYESTLAQLYLKQGRKDLALEHSALARQKAKGLATRVQWLASDIKMIVDVSPKDLEARLTPVVEEFFQLLTQLPDGFEGRNLARLKMVQDKLDSLPKDIALHEKLKKYKRY